MTPHYRFLHFKQWDGGYINDRLFGNLNISTFKKLPKINPSITIK